MQTSKNYVKKRKKNTQKNATNSETLWKCDGRLRVALNAVNPNEGLASVAYDDFIGDGQLVNARAGSSRSRKVSPENGNCARLQS